MSQESQVRVDLLMAKVAIVGLGPDQGWGCRCTDYDAPLYATSWKEVSSEGHPNIGPAIIGVGSEVGMATR